jgi:hypothetical protein
MCPFIAVRDREEQWRAWSGHVDRGRCDLPVTRRLLCLLSYTGARLSSIVADRQPTRENRSLTCGFSF